MPCRQLKIESYFQYKKASHDKSTQTVETRVEQPKKRMYQLTLEDFNIKKRGRDDTDDERESWELYYAHRARQRRYTHPQ